MDLTSYRESSKKVAEFLNKVPPVLLDSGTLGIDGCVAALKGLFADRMKCRCGAERFISVRVP